MYDILIKNGMVINGEGTPPYMADVAIHGGQIVEIGLDLGLKAVRVIDAKGKLVAPGFIDCHSHSDWTLPVYPDAESALGQGITTVFAGHCGMSPAPLQKYYAYYTFEELAFEKVLPSPIGGVNPGYPQIIEVDLFKDAYRETYGTELDWRDVDGFYNHLEREGIGTNLVSVIGHGQIRFQVLGYDNRREATGDELAKILELCEQAMEQGAAGISFGLDYDPGWFASDEELYAVANCVKKHGKILTTHYQLRPVRRGKTAVHAPIQGAIEMMELALATGVHLHLSHMTGSYNISPPNEEMEYLGAKNFLKLIDDYRSRGANITCDVLCWYSGGDYYYPNIAQRFLPYVVQAGGMKKFSDALKKGNYKKHISDDVKAGKHPSSSVMTYLNPVTMPEWGKDMLITRCARQDYEGKTIGELCKETRKNHVDLLLDILEEDPYACYNMWHTTACPVSNLAYMESDRVSIGLDVTAVNYDFCNGHPELDLPMNYRSTGTYGGYIKYLKMFKDNTPVEKVIRRMTGLTAESLGLSDRGKIMPGFAADIVVFDYDALDEHENLFEPRQRPQGIDYVIVNGKIEVEKGAHNHVRAGKVLRQ